MAPKISKTSIMATTLMLLLLNSSSEAAIQCSDVVKDLTPCGNYLMKGGSPPSNCCAGITTLASAASTAADRKAACGCIQTLAKSIQPSASAAAALPGLCNINLPFTISAGMDCSKIN
ncbi:hypothetical protein QJS10_CPA10g00269 [Acorus calamus]|uniref:Non-specific lipid-transfer protein n=1 Tax=Acorus calamus TaxID=4465 RepID=A0AAV9DYM1_ACOCL|nr:hypothetical protein QJS10_CPA10g00269 [Acorus calamus]